MIRIVILPILFLTCLVLSAQDISFNRAPSWVKEVKFTDESEVSKYDVKNGYYYKLYDYQSNYDLDAYFNHYAINIVSSGGVSSVSQLTVEFDSSFQKLDFHFLYVWRKGHKLDKTNAVKFEFVKNEDQLESSIYTGRITALAVLEDLRKDDILEYAYTLTGMNPVYKGSHFQILPLEDINPIDIIHNRVLVSTKTPIKYDCVGCEKEEVKIENVGQQQSISVLRKNTKEVKFEEGMVGWKIPYDYLTLSTTKTWKEVGEWAVQIFANKPSDLIEKTFQELFFEDYTKEDKINAITDFVQDEIRYMGIETGIGSIMPFAPDVVINQRFGDCKDKSLLMATMLNKIGVESYPALVNTTMEGELINMIPSGQLFNHCIVYFKYKDHEYWIDPTYGFQGGGFDQISTYNYKQALVVRSGVNDLTEMKVNPLTNLTEINEYFLINSFTDTAYISVSSVLYGEKADYTRNILEYYSKQDLADSYKYPYSLLYPTLEEDAKLKVKDNPVSNEIQTEERYIVTKIFEDGIEDYAGKWTFTYEPSALYNYLSNLSCEKRDYPMALYFPNSFKQVTTFEFPNPIPLDKEDIIIDNSAFYFSKKVENVAPKVVQYTYEYRSKTDAILPENFSAICQEINKIVNNLPVIFFFDKSINKLAINFEQKTIELPDEPFDFTNEDFFVGKVIDKRKLTMPNIGLVIGADGKAYMTSFKTGLVEDLEFFLAKNQQKAQNAIEVSLAVNNFFITEFKEKSKRKATLTFDYSLFYTKDNKRYELRRKDVLTEVNKDLLSVQERQIRQSLYDLLKNHHLSDFQEVEITNEVKE